MIANETLKGIQLKLSELVMSLDCDWKQEVIKENEDGSNKYRFSTVIANNLFVVEEKSVRLSKDNVLDEGVFTESKAIESDSKISNLYRSLVKRYRDKDDIDFYNKVYEDINKLIEEQNNKDEDKGDDGRDVALFNSRSS